MTKNINIQPLVDVVSELRAPNGCPWDRKQTHESLRRYFIEEVYEVMEAIDNKDVANLREELGDVLLQIVFHAQLATERGAFTMQDVIDDVTNKMIRRHPHVFPVRGGETDSLSESGNQKLDSSASEAGDTSKSVQMALTWDELKAQEHGEERKNILDGISVGLPALLRAQKLQEKAAKVGFDWTEEDPVWAKVDEEMAEFKEAIQENNQENMENEAGDVLFSLINLFRWYKISGENALIRTNTKFHRRFAHVERRVNQSGRAWGTFSLSELDAFGDEAKVQEK